MIFAVAMAAALSLSTPTWTQTPEPCAAVEDSAADRDRFVEALAADDVPPLRRTAVRLAQDYDTCVASPLSAPSGARNMFRFYAAKAWTTSAAAALGMGDRDSARAELESAKVDLANFNGSGEDGVALRRDAMTLLQSIDSALPQL